MSESESKPASENLPPRITTSATNAESFRRHLNRIEAAKAEKIKRAVREVLLEFGFKPKE